MRLRPFYRYLFLLFLTLGVFYPSIFGEALSLDDSHMIEAILNRGEFAIETLFFPQEGLYYYRPLLYLSFVTDFFLFGCRPEIMHFENILIHAANVLLLAWLAHRFFSFRSEGERLAPWLIAAFFAIHPLVTESVNWISGRTDLMAAFFSLLAAASFLRDNNDKQGWRDWLAALFLLLGLLCKEVAAATGLALALSLFWREIPGYTSIWKKRLLRLLPIFFAILVYLWMRTDLNIMQNSGFAAVVNGSDKVSGISWWPKTANAFVALGFYAKKIIWPFPLNFAIINVNRSFYLPLGIFIFCASVWLAYKHQGRTSFSLLWSLLHILPALAVAASAMAWTPVAERYLYISLAGFLLATGLFLNKLYSSSGNKILFLLLLILLIGFGATTVQRNITWQSNLKLFEDTVAKSPNMAILHSEYAIALLNAGQKEKAQQQFEIASKIGTGKALHVAQLNLQEYHVAFSAKDDSQLLELLSQKSSDPFYQKWLLHKQARYLTNKGLAEKDPNRQRLINEQELDVQKQIYKAEGDPYALYRQGQLYLALGNKKLAATRFHETCKKSTEFYTQAACSLAKRLQEEP
jgi:uncharacterized membrane protein